MQNYEWCHILANREHGLFVCDRQCIFLQTVATGKSPNISMPVRYGMIARTLQKLSENKWKYYVPRNVRNTNWRGER